MPLEQLRQERFGMRSQSSVVYQHQAYRAAIRIYRRVEQGAGEIGRAECIVSHLAQLGPEQSTVPLVGKDKQNS